MSLGQKRFALCLGKPLHSFARHALAAVRTAGGDILRLRPLFLCAALAVSLAPALSPAEESAQAGANVERSARDGVLKLLPADSVTEHELTIGGRKIA